MPIYEYRCADCDATFERLRPMSQADASASCVHCGSNHASRTLSLFAAITRSSGGESRTISGTGKGCSSCGASSCATCSH